MDRLPEARSLVFEWETSRFRRVMLQLRESGSSIDLSAYLPPRICSRIDCVEALLHLGFNTNEPLKRDGLEPNSLVLRDVRMGIDERHAPVGE
jgi:hypothetical protein